ncbi:glycerophosphodiester phosphodiesterase family protein [Rhodohalobacter sp. 8-1]|uniref:glycerophosphodiester phosphodiesterase family protein n=1 Tax=Rhodohalobacter sp. 8-1 TaxID=3131972 RepID=UPI0030EF6DC6
MKRLTLLCLLIVLGSACSLDEPSFEYDLQGHRGARGLLPENTIPGFLRAVEEGVDTVELDVVVTSDRQVVVSHEPWFNHTITSRADGSPVTQEVERSLNIFEMTFEETQLYDVGRRGNSNFPDQQAMDVTKPLLAEAILAVETYVYEQNYPPVRYNIETKSQPDWYGVYSPLPNEFAQLLYDQLVDLDILDRTIVQSFDPLTLIAMRQLDPDVTLAMLVYDESQSVELMTEILGFTPDIWSPSYDLVTPLLVDKTDRLGMKLIPWTVNDRDEMIRLLELGVDGIITDYPNRAP